MKIENNMIRDGAIIFRKNSFSWKNLFKKPAVFVIQVATGRFNWRGFFTKGKPLFTRGEGDHIAYYYNNNVYEYLKSSNGFFISTLNDWKIKNLQKKITANYYNLKKALTPEQKIILEKFIKKEKTDNREFGVLQAMFSAVDKNSIAELIIDKIDQDKFLAFCSGGAERMLHAIYDKERLPRPKYNSKSDPDELVRRLIRYKIITHKVRMK